MKVLVTAESFVYAIHFTLLGNLSAAACAAVSGTRTFMALKTRSTPLAICFIVLNIALGFAFAKTSAGWLPVIASCLATVAIFFMDGVRMRLSLLVSTLLWLANNIISGSIGGTMLESVIATMNITTVILILRARSQAEAAKAAA